MRCASLWVLLMASFLCSDSSFGFKLTSELHEAGSVLVVTCDGNTESACQLICGHASRCEVTESWCRSCDGTQSLAMKRIFDGVGTSLIARGSVRPDVELIRILSTGNFTALHPATLHNYSSPFDGEQVRAQFRALCPELPETSLRVGFLLLELNPIHHAFTRVLGVVCPDEKTGEVSFYWAG